MDPTRNTHVKLLAADFNSLAVSSSAPPTISRHGRPIFRAESLGIVTSRNLRPKLLRFLIDDGSGCVPCVLWLNHHLLPHSSDASEHAAKVQIGGLVRVRGRVTVFRGEVQITVKDVVVERDPNTEILHWLQCIKLARDFYDLPLAVPHRA
ncbi:CST complex subunit STN1 [Phalaenopsis equestris]|uniref:CST complex subunit STN1 n=1 Tax=Phalaenopsis equestris TaxID=78828 RepID=UPI0009E25777|nr:CST complex subunit STN1 [Phalaenopsis equestris]XP_020578754.1 CST complex subunit STN1 [Phalaenopsis equestris]